MKHMVTILLAILVGTGCATVGDDEVAYYPVPNNDSLPFSEAVRADDFIFVSGTLGTDPNASELRLVPGGIQAETKQTLENIKAILERHGASMDDVVKVTCMMADMSEWGAMNEVYVTYFPNHKPARSAFAASGLAFNARVEIEAIAFVGDE